MALATEGIQLGAIGTVTFTVGREEISSDGDQLVLDWETRSVEDKRGGNALPVT